MATSSNTYNINVNTNQAVQSLNNLQSKLGDVNNSFGALKSALTGAAVTAFTAQAYKMANALTDMAAATGISTQALLGLRTAISANGGSAEGAVNSVAKFNIAINEAASGSKELQDAFLTLGISLEEIGSLSEEDLLRKTIDGLASVEDNAKRTAISSKLLGKEMRSVDFKGVASDIDSATKAQARNAAAVEAAGRTSQGFSNAYNQLQISLLAALEPLSKLANALLENKEAVQTFLDTFAKIGVTLAGAFIFSKLAGSLRNLVDVFRVGTSTGKDFATGIKYLKDAFNLKSAAIVKSYTGFGILGQTIKSLAGGFGRLIPIIGQAISAFFLLDGAVKLLTGNTLGEWFDKSAEGLERFVTNKFPALAKNINELGKALGMAPSPVEQKSIDETKKAAKAKEEQAAAARQVADALEKEKSALASILEQYKQGNDELNRRFQLETNLIGASEEQRIRSQQLLEAETKFTQERIKLQERLDAARKSTSPSEQGLVPQLEQAQRDLTDAYNQQISAINANVSARESAVRTNNIELFQTKSLVDSQTKLAEIQNQIANVGLPKFTQQTNQLTQAMRASADAAIAEEEARRKQKLDPNERQKYYDAATAGVEKLTEAQRRLNEVLDQQALKDFGIRNRIDLENEEIRVLDELTKSTMSELERKYYDIGAAARDKAKAAIDAWEAENGVKMSLEQQQKYYQEAFKGVDKLARAHEELYNQSRRFETGWKRAFDEYVDEATNAAKQAERLFKKATSGMEDLLVNFVKTGKFEWKGFVQDMLETLLRSQIQQTFANIMGGLQNSMGGGIFESIGSLLGFGSGGTGQQRGNNPSTPLYVANVAGGMGGISGIGGIGGNPLISGGGIGGGVSGIFSGISNAVSGIASGIGNVFGGVVDTVSSIGSGIWDAVGSIGSLFDGWFANGGTIGAGKFGIVGERGPEFVSGPATVTPMQPTSVTYNINAVDAMSFKQMIAQDPSFIHAVAMQGARTVPGRY